MSTTPTPGNGLEGLQGTSAEHHPLPYTDDAPGRVQGCYYHDMKANQHSSEHTIDSKNGSQESFARGLRLLTQIAELGEVTASELSHSLGIPLSTTYRYLKSLREYELIEEHAGRYIPGWRLSSWSTADANRARLVESGAKVLNDLRDASGRTAALAVRAGLNAICIREAIAPGDEPIAFKIKEVLPLDRGAGQRVLLSFAPPAVVEGVIRQGTDTAVDHAAIEYRRKRILREIADVRSCGFAISDGELKAGAHAIAAPVFLHGEVLCSLVVAGMRPFPSQEAVNRTRQLILQAAHDLSAMLATELR